MTGVTVSAEDVRRFRFRRQELDREVLAPGAAHRGVTLAGLAYA